MSETTDFLVQPPSGKAKVAAWFALRFGIDLRSLAVFRVGLGVLLFLDCIMRLQDLSAHYSDDGLLPRAPYIEKFSSVMHTSIFMANGQAFWPALLFVITALVSLLLVVGYKSRLMAFFGWFLLISIHNRNPMILNGGDVLFRMLLFWAIFLPTGAKFSLDQALTRLTPEKDAAGRQDFSALTLGGPALAMTLQIAFVYWSTAFLKTGREWWPDGTASYYALALEQFTTPFGMWLGKQSDLLHWSTYGVYFLEMFGPFFFFSPFFFGPIRTVAVIAFMALHLNFDLTMRLGLFPWIDIVGLSALLPSWFWNQLEALNGKSSGPMSIFYDEACTFCEKMALIVRAFTVGEEVRLLKAQSAEATNQALQSEYSWIVVDGKGTHHYRFDGLRALLEASPYTGIIWRHLPLKWLHSSGGFVYRLVAANRPFLGRLTARYLPFRRSDPTAVGWFAQVATILLIVYVGLLNLKTIPKVDLDLGPWDKIAQYLRLDQKWNMFAPFPLKDDGWYVIPGKLNDGTEFDLFPPQQHDLIGSSYPPVSWDKPSQVSATYKNARWRKYMMNIWQKKKKEHRLYYGRYLCRSFNKEQLFDRKLLSFEIFFVKERTPPPDEEAKTERVSIWKHDCFPNQAVPVVPAPSLTPAPR